LRFGAIRIPQWTLPQRLGARSGTARVRSRRVPPQALDALENLSKERPGQVTFGELQREVPRVPDQPPARLEEPLLDAPERPVLDGGRHQPTEQVAEVIGDDAEQQPYLRLVRTLLGPNYATPSVLIRGIKTGRRHEDVES